jgi:pyridoxal 5'-phosphate synthase pdxS subunit
MTIELPVANGGTYDGNRDSAFTVKAGLARMLQGGVIMDVVNAEQV